MTLFVWLLMGIALSLPAGLWLVQHNMHVANQELDDDTGMAVYFVLDLEDSQVDAMARELRRDPIVDQVKVISADQALAEFREFSGYDEPSLSFDTNPLPASLSLHIASDADSDLVNQLIVKLEEAAIVDNVVFDSQWSVQLQRIREIVMTLTLIVSGLFGIGVVFVSVSAVRFAIDSKLDELKVNLLLGASYRFVRRPFTYCGVLYGFGGGVVASVILVLSVHAVKGPLQDIAAIYGGSIEFVAMNWVLTGFLVFAGSSLGLLGAFHATLLHIRTMKSSD